MKFVIVENFLDRQISSDPSKQKVIIRESRPQNNGLNPTSPGFSGLDFMYFSQTSLSSPDISPKMISSNSGVNLNPISSHILKFL